MFAKRSLWSVTSDESGGESSRGVVQSRLVDASNHNTALLLRLDSTLAYHIASVRVLTDISAWTRIGLDFSRSPASPLLDSFTSSSSLNGSWENSLRIALFALVLRSNGLESKAELDIDAVDEIFNSEQFGPLAACWITSFVLCALILNSGDEKNPHICQDRPTGVSALT